MLRCQCVRDVSGMYVDRNALVTNVNNPNYAFGAVAYSCPPPVQNTIQCQLMQRGYGKDYVIPVGMKRTVCPGPYPVIMDLFGGRNQSYTPGW